MFEANLFVSENNSLSFVQNIGTYSSSQEAETDIISLYKSAFSEEAKIELQQLKQANNVTTFSININESPLNEFIQIKKLN